MITADDRIADLRHALARLGPFGDESEPGGDPQDDGEETEELAHEADDRRLALALLDTVRSVFGEPPRRLARRQAGWAAAHA